MSDNHDQPCPGESAAARLDARLVPAALTCWVVTAAGIWWPIGRPVAACCVVLAAVSGLLAWRAVARSDGTGRLRAVAVGLSAVGVTGAGFGLAVALRAEAVERHPITAAFGTAAPVTVTPSESPVSLGRGRLMFRATMQRLRDEQISGRVVVFARAPDFESDGDGLMVGRPVRFTARIGHPTRRDLTVAVLNASGRPTMGTAGAVQRAAHTVRGRFAAAVRGTLPAEQAAMLPALVLGDTSAVTAETDRDFRAAGMTHLMAVSGANVTIVCGAVLFSARVVGPRAAVVLAGLALVAFVVVVQPTASVLRAAVMGAIALAGVLTSRRRQAIPALCATVLGLLALAPQLAVDVGFALSVAATAALVVIAPGWSRRLAGRGCPKPLADALSIAAAAHVVTAPLVAGISGRVSLVAMAANLAAAPVIAPITVLGSAAAVLSVAWAAGAHLLIRFTGPELWWVVRVARWSAGAPAATVPVPSGMPGVLLVAAVTVLIVVVVARRRGRRWLGAAAALCALAWWLSDLLDPGAV
ncbi:MULTISPECIES: ComEC/Rec2 family competence protein [unclassified Mycobacterium]|uniref:ComEC/Rec2 family competence protein n=1 Tax=unclassified Mycobacterium TaxID=2642494 RepID=UPI0007FEF43D|nr:MULTISPECIES: ComEC/Rec2 family competence protein [unclassified Mycobacterium]OBG54830.1 competence protein [Mycobacterium sp. E735]OBG70742.1 competence protein [Mycobacterium sp. E3298]